MSTGVVRIYREPYATRQAARVNALLSARIRTWLASMPGHLPVHIAAPADGSGGGADVDYLYTLDCQLEAFPTQGRMVVITINPEPK